MKGGEPAAAEEGGIWSLEDDGLVLLARSGGSTPIVLVPSEHVLMVALDLPLPSRRERAAALPFAIEDLIADPLGDVHVVLGMELSPRRHLAAAVRHSLMAQWMETIEKAGLAYCSLIPDALALPVPGEGNMAVQLARGRVLVRTAEGTGFATSLDQFPTIWAAAGRPPCLSYGELLPPEIPSVPLDAELEPLTARLMVPALDLRSGLYARPRRPLPAVARKVLAILAVGVLAHGLIAAADTLALHRMAQERRQVAEALVQLHVPGTTLSEGFAADVTRVLSYPEARRSSFFPLLARASQALAQAGSGTTLRRLAFDERRGELTLQLGAATMADFQRAQTALSGAGLNPSGTPLVTNEGATEATIVLRTAPIGPGA